MVLIDMRPDAPAFAPRSAAPHRMERALVRHEPLAGRSSSTPFSHQPASTDGGSRPRDLVIHESIRQLVTDMILLKEHCEELEAMNVRLTARVNSQEAQLRSVRAGAGGRPNLTAYSSSSSSEENDDTSKDLASSLLPAIGELLAKHETSLNDQADRFKGFEARIQSLETNRDNNVDHKTDTDINISKKPGEDLDSYLQDKIERLNDKLASTIEKTKTLEEKVETEIALATANDREAQLGRTKEYQSDTTDDESSQMILDLKHDLELMKRMRKHEQTIDDAATKDELYRMFYHLTSDMFRDKGVKRRYRLPEEELFTLRSRVVRRLALFDACGAAFTEAKTADVGL